MLVLIWFVVCIIFYLVQKILGNSGHALELFALLTALALFFIDRLSRKAKNEKIFSNRKPNRALTFTSATQFLD